jgi:hypothetical protein
VLAAKLLDVAIFTKTLTLYTLSASNMLKQGTAKESITKAQVLLTENVIIFGASSSFKFGFTLGMTPLSAGERPHSCVKR